MRTDNNGYNFIKTSGHPRANRDGWIFEHILIAEKALGHQLPSKAVIHHHDENKRNNKPSNLVICENEKYHNLLHNRMRILKAGGNPDTQKLCSQCEKVKLRSEFYSHSNKSDNLQSICKDCSKSNYKKYINWNLK